MTGLFEYADRYPNAPGFRERDTSKAAADSMKECSGRLRRQVLDAIRACPRTVWELHLDLRMDIRTASARASELLALGKIEDSGQRRLTGSGRKAKVWRVRP